MNYSGLRDGTGDYGIIALMMEVAVFCYAAMSGAMPGIVSCGTIIFGITLCSHELSSFTQLRVFR